MYAVRKEDGPRLVLEHFGIKDPSNGATARMGEELAIAGLPIIEGRLSADDGGRHRIAVSLIRGGKIWQQFEGDTPLAFEFVDRETRAVKTYYRLTVRGRSIGKLLSNPVFIANR